MASSSSSGEVLSVDVINALDDARDILRRLASSADKEDLSWKDLPVIVVVGEQSAGKSSLMSSIIKVPLLVDAKTATRAPLEIRARPSSSGNVEVEIEYDVYDPSKQAMRPETKRFDNVEGDTIQRAIRSAQDAMAAALRSAPESFKTGHMLRPDEECWLLKQVIKLTVKSPHIKSGITLLDLPGLVQVQSALRKDFEDYVKFFVMNRNAIIMLVTPVATGTPHQTSHAWAAINDWVQDRKQLGHRLLVVFTKPDLSSPAQHKALQDSMLQDGGSFVLVCTKGADQVPSGTDLAAHFASLEEAENRLLAEPHYSSLCKEQLGTSALVQQLNNRLAAALSGTLPELMNKLRKHVEYLEGLLQRTKADDTTGAREMLEQVCSRFQEACRGVSLPYPIMPIAPGEVHLPKAVMDSMHLHTQLRKWADWYANQQSYFIPGLLGKRHVREVIQIIAGHDIAVGGPDELSKHITERLHHEFFKPSAVEHALSFVDNTCDCILTALCAIIDRELKDTYQLRVEVKRLATKELDVFRAELCDAACLLVTAFDADAQTLHVQPLFMTYVNILSDAAVSIRGDVLGVVGKAAGVLAKVAIVATGALTPLGPAAALLGLAAEMTVEQVAAAVQKVISGYMQRYTEASKQPRFGQYHFGQANEYILTPIPWDDQQRVPYTAFEMVCKAMNCSPGFVVAALKAYSDLFKDHASGTNQYTAEQLHKVLIDTMARMLCTYHAVTESVNKLVRFRLAASEKPGVSSPSCTSLPYKLQQRLREDVIVKEGQLKKLLEDEQLTRERSEWEREKEVCEGALTKLETAQKHSRSLTPLPEMPIKMTPVPADHPAAPSSPPPSAPAPGQSSSTPSPTQVWPAASWPGEAAASAAHGYAPSDPSPPPPSPPTAVQPDQATAGADHGYTPGYSPYPAVQPGQAAATAAPAYSPFSPTHAAYHAQGAAPAATRTSHLERYPTPPSGSGDWAGLEAATSAHFNNAALDAERNARPGQPSKFGAQVKQMFTSVKK